MRKMRKLFFIALLAVATTGAFAQRSGSGAPHFSAGRRQSFSGHRSSFSPLGLFSDPFFSDAISQSGYPVASQPPVIFLQNALASTPMAEPVPQSAQPLLIELQGNNYVRLSGPDDIHSGTSRTEPARQNSRTSSLASANSLARDTTSRGLAPVTLIFRDGHRDQVSDYTIADNVLYARGDYYADGSWYKKIELSSLDLPQTIKLNQAPEVRFRLPAAPNEVITRP
jgi:hypothetical protein